MVADDGVDAPVARAIPALEAVGVGVFAHDPASGEVYAAHRDRRPRPPASTAKLVTAALALDRLGPAHRFTTRAICSRSIDGSGDRSIDGSGDHSNDRSGDPSGDGPPTAPDDRAAGDPDDRLDRLVLRGDWLSDLPVEALRGLSRAVETAGVGGVGDLVLDVSGHDRRRYGPGWTWEDERRAYGAKSTPLALAGNTVDVAVRARDDVGGGGVTEDDATEGDVAEDDVAVSVEPDSAAVDLAVDVTVVDQSSTAAGEGDGDPSTDAGDCEPSVDVYREHGSSTVRVEGRLAPGEEHRDAAPVGAPLAHLGDVLRRELEAAGVAVDGDVRVATSSPGAGRDRDGRDRDGTHRTDRDGTDRDGTGRDGNRTGPDGDGIGRDGTACGPAWNGGGTDGWIRRSPPVGELVRAMCVTSDNFVAEQLARAVARRERGRGSWAAWRSVVADALADLDAGPAALRDGSGLSQYSRVAPRGLVCVIDWALAQPWGPTFLGSLPVAGEEGTLADRLGDVGPTVRAKTGTLTGTRALAGVIERDDRRVTFAALLGDLTGDHEANGHDYLDDLVRELVVATD